MSQDGGTPSLLDPLTEDQQALVEVLGGVYAEAPGIWPVFDYVEAILDDRGVDAIKTFISFPSIEPPGGSYSAVWSAGGPRNWPRADHVVALTVLGMHRCVALRKFPRSLSIPEIDLARAFIDLLDIAAKTRRAAVPYPTAVRTMELRSDKAIAALIDRGYRFDQLPQVLLWDLMDKEPPLRGGGSSNDDGWTRSLQSKLFDFEDVVDLDDYVRRLEVQATAAPLPVTLAAPSPLGLVTAMDYLDTVWQLAFARSLFRHASAERTAKLSHPANTADEFTSRLSAIGEVLRGARAAIPKPRANDTTQRPLRSLERYLTNQLGAGSEARIQDAIHTLENVLFVRDHGQHTEAGTRAASALVELQIGYPPGSWTAAWEMIQAQSIESLGAIRDELQAHRAAKASGTI